MEAITSFHKNTPFDAYNIRQNTKKKKKKKNLGTKIISTQIKVGNQIQFKKNIYVYGY